MPAINRFKNQLNENSARFARIGAIPEMNHNEAVAWGGVGDDQDPEATEQALIFLSWEEPEGNDMPGVVARSDRDWALEKYPDPRMVLGPIY